MIQEDSPNHPVNKSGRIFLTCGYLIHYTTGLRTKRSRIDEEKCFKTVVTGPLLLECFKWLKCPNFAAHSVALSHWQSCSQLESPFVSLYLHHSSRISSEIGPWGKLVLTGEPWNSRWKSVFKLVTIACLIHRSTSLERNRTKNFDFNWTAPNQESLRWGIDIIGQCRATLNLSASISTVSSSAVSNKSYGKWVLAEFLYRSGQM